MSTKIIRVQDVMKRQFMMISGMITVKDALIAMKETNASALIIEKRNDDDEYGMVLFADIAKKVLAQDRAPERVNVFEIMTKPVVSVHDKMDVRYCARLFDNLGLSYAPVVDADEKITGIVGYRGLVMQGILAE